MKRLCLLIVMLLCLFHVSSFADTAYIVGKDNRQNADQGIYPYSAIANIYSIKTCGCTYSYTGFMISSDLLMLPAEAMVCSQHGQKAEELHAWFGYENDAYSLYHFMYQGEPCIVGTDFIASDGRYHYNDIHDYAVIRVGSEVGRITGWFGLYARSDAELRDHLFEVAGYSDGMVKTDFGAASTNSANDFYTDADSSRDASGSPVFDGYAYASGIQVARSNNHLRSYACRITEDILREIRAFSPSFTGKPSRTIDSNDLSGRNLAGTWELVSSSRLSMLNSGAAGARYTFENGQMTMVMYMNGEPYMHATRDYTYQDHTLYVHGSPDRSMLTISGDTVVFIQGSEKQVWKKIK